MRREYGLTLAEYNYTLAYQKGACAICRKKPLGNRLSVDHNHVTGELRGLLCWSCNRAVAVFKDSVTLLDAAAWYLKHPPICSAFWHARFTAPGRVGTKKRAKLLKLLHKSNEGVND